MKFTEDPDKIAFLVNSLKIKIQILLRWKQIFGNVRYEMNCAVANECTSNKDSRHAN